MDAKRGEKNVRKFSVINGPRIQSRGSSPRFSGERAALHLKRENTGRFNGTDGGGGRGNPERVSLVRKEQNYFHKNKKINSYDVRDERDEKPCAVRRYAIYLRRNSRVFRTEFVFAFYRRKMRIT